MDTGQGVSPFFEARRERLTAFQVLACKIMPEQRLRFATIKISKFGDPVSLGCRFDSYTVKPLTENDLRTLTFTPQLFLVSNWSAILPINLTILTLSPTAFLAH